MGDYNEALVSPPWIEDAKIMIPVEEGDAEETISMVEEVKRIYLVAEVTEVPISGAETTASIIVIVMNGITTSDITAMSPQVVKDRERMTKM